MSSLKPQSSLRTISRNYSVAVILLSLLASFVVYLQDRSKIEPVIEPLHLPAWPGLPTLSKAELEKNYKKKGTQVQIVAGHTNQYPGAVASGLREADLNLKLAAHLERFLRQDDNFRVRIARDVISGEYVAELLNYFRIEEQSITQFKENLRSNFKQLTASGEVSVLTDGVHHNFARPEVATQLYGLNKLAGEIRDDVIIHIHFNDYPGRRSNQSGIYSGFSVYVPEKQYSNGPVSKALAEPIVFYLKQISAPSTLPVEREINEDQELIALGSNNSLDKSASILIEYGYIYEDAWQNLGTQEAITKELAWLTYLGLKEFFDPEVVAGLPKTTLLPYQFKTDLYDGLRGSEAVLVLQKVLQLEGLYPPVGRTLTECPIIGNFGRCTLESVKAFQQKYQLSPTGYVGGKTLEKLNELSAG